MKIKLASAGIGILLLIGGSIGWYYYNKPHADVSGIDASVKITAENLYNDFQQNETLANNKYLNKVIEVTGSVSEIQNENGSQIILLASNGGLGGVNCRLSNDNKNIIDKKSTTITLKGRCTGYTMDVNLVDCIFK